MKIDYNDNVSKIKTVIVIYDSALFIHSLIFTISIVIVTTILVDHRKDRKNNNNHNK